MSKRIGNRTLSKKDDLSLRESLEIIGKTRQDRDSGLIIPHDLKIERRKVCGYCGRPWENKPKAKYFGETFHKDCVDAMLRGEQYE